MQPSWWSSRIFHALERYGYILENGQELFIMGDNDNENVSFTYNQAMLNKNSIKWLEVMHYEMDSMGLN